MRLKPYNPEWGGLIAGWVTSDLDLCWLAPGTVPPLTSEKITSWKKVGGACLLGMEGRSRVPVAYGELNPMRTEAGHLWIGHIVVDPSLRGCGLGRAFVRKLLEEAFHKQGARRVSLVVFPENRGAVHCYEHCGFRIVGDERHRFLPGGPRHRLLRLEADPSALTSHRPQLRSSIPVAR